MLAVEHQLEEVVFMTLGMFTSERDRRFSRFGSACVVERGDLEIGDLSVDRYPDTTVATEVVIDAHTDRLG